MIEIDNCVVILQHFVVKCFIESKLILVCERGSVTNDYCLCHKLNAKQTFKISKYHNCPSYVWKMIFDLFRTKLFRG